MTKRIFFIDSKVTDFATLISELPQDSEWFLLDEDQDGVRQMAAILAGRTGLDAIHVISHGSEGAIYLGNTVLNSAGLETYRTELNALGNALTENGDLLLYGCNVGAGGTGQTFIAQLSELTGADVAASDDLTGTGGDWLLETRTGGIEAAAITPQGYAGNLEVWVGTASADTKTGSAGDDTLTGAGGNDTLDGAAGTDTANYSGLMADYRFGLNGSGQITITDTNAGNGDEGTDTLIGVEQASFTDGNVTLKLLREVRVNSYTTSLQTDPSVAALSGGGYVVTWMSDGQDGSNDGIYSQRFAADGTALGSEVRVNTNTTDYQNYASVAALSGGGYVVTWMSFQDGGSYGIYSQRYAADGTTLGSEVRVNTYIPSLQSHPSVTALSGGGYVVTWMSDGQDGSSYGIYSQRFAADGTALGSEVRVNSYTTNNQYYPSVAGLSGGGYVVTWMSDGQDGSGWGIYSQRYAADGTTLGSEVRANTFTSNNQSFPSVTALSGGGYVVTWQSSDGSDWGIYSQRFAADGSALGSEVRVNTYTSLGQVGPSVAALSGGGYVVTWMSDSQDSSGWGIYSQRFAADGSALGSEVRVNITTLSDQSYPSVAALSGGGYVVTWQSVDQDGSGYNIYSQQFDPAGNPVSAKLNGDNGANPIVWQNSGNVWLVGGLGNDTLTGSTGNDFLDGGTGVDTLAGDAGDDTYLIDNSSDVINDTSGSDTAQASASFNLATQASAADNLTLTGSAHLNGTGNALANLITGNSGNNQLAGEAGNDTLQGGGGADSFTGGIGNDLFYVDSADDTVSENAGEGTDAVISTFSYTLVANVENLTLTGNALGNALTGNGGNDTLDGGAGTDTSNYSGTLAGYRFGFNGSGQITITDTDAGNGDEGTDTLIGVEEAIFTDGYVTLRSLGEGRVNTYTASSQAAPSVAALSGGGYVVTWKSDGQDGSSYGIYSQRYAADGTALGSEVRVNTYTSSSQADPSVAALSGGGYVVTWSSQQSTADYDIYSQRYAADGTTLGSEVRVNSNTTSTQDYPSVAALSGGGYVVTWMSFQDGSDYGIYSQRYAADGTALGSEVRVNTYTSSTQSYPSVTALSGGGYVVTWQSIAQDGNGSGWGIYSQRYAADGTALGSEVRVNTYTTGSQYSPSVTSLSGGGYVVTWQSDGQDGSGSGIYSQRYTADGTALGSEVRVNTYTTSFQTLPSVAALSGGGYVVTWQSDGQDGSDSGIYSQRYTADGTALGSEVRVNTYTTSFQSDPSVAALSGGGYVVTWQSSGQDGSGQGIYSQQFDPAGNPVSAKLEGDSVANPIVWQNSGNVWLVGGLGNDTLAGGSGSDYIEGGADTDTASYATASSGVTASLASGGPTGQGIDTLVGIENITGSDHGDSFTGDTGANLLDGGAGNDTLNGGGGRRQPERRGRSGYRQFCRGGFCRDSQPRHRRRTSHRRRRQRQPLRHREPDRVSP